MKRLNVLIMSLGIVLSLLGAPAGAADQKTFIMGYDPGLTCHIGQYAVLVKGFFAEEGLRVRGVPALDTRTAVANGRSHRLWVKTDAALTEADFGYFDENQDGKVSRKEFVEKPSVFILRFDKNGDCRVTPEELRAATTPQPTGGPQERPRDRFH